MAYPQAADLQARMARGRQAFPMPRGRSRAHTIPAPVGGWNARDSLADMPPQDAVQLENWFPNTTSVDLRNGYTQHATGLGSQVETVMAYTGSTTEELFGITANGRIYDATASGAVGAADVTGLSNGRWQYVNIATPGGNFLWLCNGVDAPYTYNGSAWANPSISGVTATELINVNLHKNRLWAIQVGTLKAWYLPVQSIAGTMAALDLSSFCTRGGYLVAMATWTVDAGYGVDDMAVFITSEGEVLVYRGTDPSSASTWALVGVYWIGAPIGRRCFVKYQGDVLIICEDGVYPLSGALQSSRVQPQVALSFKIQQATSMAVSLYGSNFGWQLLPYPNQNMLFLNVPVSTGNNQEQYVMNTITKAWCNFSGWNANCWELFQENPYFGANGFIGKAWSGTSDAGTAIQANGLQAFNYFRTPSELKRWTMMRPIFSVTGTPSLYANVNVDFDLSDTTATLSFSPITQSVWDTAVWDTGTWTGTAILKNWQGATGVGYCAAPRVKSAASSISVSWMSTDLVYESGIIL